MARLGSIEGDDEDVYQTFFEENTKDEHVLISPQFIMRMHIEKTEAAWTKIYFQSKS